MQHSLDYDFSGKWILLSDLNRGDCDKCIERLGHSAIKISALSKAQDVQIWQHYLISGEHTIQRRVTYSVKGFEMMGLGTFTFNEFFPLVGKDRIEIPTPEDKRGFGKATVRGEVLDSHTYAVVRDFLVQGRPTRMSVKTSLRFTDQLFPNTARPKNETVPAYALVVLTVGDLPASAVNRDGTEVRDAETLMKQLANMPNVWTCTKIYQRSQTTPSLSSEDVKCMEEMSRGFSEYRFANKIDKHRRKLHKKDAEQRAEKK